MLKRLLLAVATMAVCGSIAALAAGVYTPGLPAMVPPFTGIETIPADTNLAGGAAPQTESVTITQLLAGASTPTDLSNVTTCPCAVAVNAGLSNLYKITLTSSGQYMATPTNLTAGKVFRLQITQDATGSRLFSFATPITTWSNSNTTLTSVPPTLSTLAGTVDMFTFIYDGNRLRGIPNLNFR